MAERRGPVSGLLANALNPVWNVEDYMAKSRAKNGERVRATLTEVAQRAGVSRQTVSRVARGGALVNAETVARVQRVIEELDYRPNLVARALSTGHSRLIGVLAHVHDSFGPNTALNSVVTAAHRQGYGISIVSLESFDPSEVGAAIVNLSELGCAGIVAIAPWVADSGTLHHLQSPIPIVTTSELQTSDIPAVHLDSLAAAREAVSYLVQLGHRSVAHVSGAPGQNATGLRIRGWELALRDVADGPARLFEGDWTSRSGYIAGLAVAEDPDITAVFTANDRMALGVLYALHERGLRVPEDVSVMGFDATPDSEFIWPGLSTVGVDPGEVGGQAVGSLLRLVAGESVASTILPHTLIVRSSTGIPGTRAR